MRRGDATPPRTSGPPVINIRNTSSPHWHAWLKPENRCLAPANSFAEYALSLPCPDHRAERNCRADLYLGDAGDPDDR